MAKQFQVIFFRDQKGNNPLREYMTGKNDTDWIVIINVIQSLRRVGQDLLGDNMAKRIDKNLFELRKNRHRLLYAEYKPGYFIILHVFLKKTQKIPPDCLKRAKRNFSEYLSLGNYEEFIFPIDY